MPQDTWIWRSDRVIPSKTGAGRHVLQEVLQQLERQHWVQHDIFGVHLAIEEALINAIKHGNRLDTSKQVHVTCRISSNLLRVEIADEGEGFDPSTVPDPTDPTHIESPSGRGIMLMQSFMSRVEYNDAGNRVVMEKERAKSN